MCAMLIDGRYGTPLGKATLKTNQYLGRMTLEHFTKNKTNSY